MRQDGKTSRTEYTGNGVKSIEWIDPPKKGTKKAAEPKAEKTEKAKE